MLERFKAMDPGNSFRKNAFFLYRKRINGKIAKDIFGQFYKRNVSKFSDFILISRKFLVSWRYQGICKNDIARKLVNNVI